MNSNNEFINVSLKQLPKKLHNKVKLYRAKRVLETFNDLNMHEAYVELIEAGLTTFDDEAQG